jgi:hypothetical protein
VKGGYCGHGVGSLVICRYLLSVSWRLLRNCPGIIYRLFADYFRTVPNRRRLEYSRAGGGQ